MFVVHISFGMFLWCFIHTIISDPGRVPLYWGFFLEDPEHKKRRFCLVCHIFKPERCHHCSACDRCVLNMDHHCPWINNCVGFYNRKFFLLMLFYGLISLFFCFIILAPTVFVIFKALVSPQAPLFLSDLSSSLFSQVFTDDPQEKPSTSRAICLFVGFVLACILIPLLTMFFRFHVNLVLDNFTTIESLERKRSNIPDGPVRQRPHPPSSLTTH